MTKQSISSKTPTPSEAPSSIAPQPPFSRDQFQIDIAEVYLFYVRSIAYMVDHETAWAVAKLPAPKDDGYTSLHNPELSAADLGITFDHIRYSELARALMRLYDYAYFGAYDRSEDPLEYESIHTWISCLVCDVADSHVAEEWCTYGSWGALESSRRCIQAAETASARATLEGGEPIYPSFQSPSKDGSLTKGVLTVRQMSLLSGMEEMSIRAAANPKRPNPLKTISIEGGTRVEIAVAKEWLQSKGRYVPITYKWSSGEIDLSKSSFQTLSSLQEALDARFKMCCNEYGRKAIDEVLAESQIETRDGLPGPYLAMNPEDFESEGTVRTIARALRLPEDLLVLRVNEALTKDRLKKIERDLRSATQKSTQR